MDLVNHKKKKEIITEAIILSNRWKIAKTTALEKVADLEDELVLTNGRIATLEYDVHIVTSNVITFLYGTPNQSYEAVLLLTPTGPVQRMEPLTNLKVTIKNKIDVFYLSVVQTLSLTFFFVFFFSFSQHSFRAFLLLSCTLLVLVVYVGCSVIFMLCVLLYILCYRNGGTIDLTVL